MFPKLLNIFLAFVAYSTIEEPFLQASSIGEKMKTVGIVPHVISIPPLHQAKVTFYSGFFSRIMVQARDGDSFPYTQVWRAPAVSWPSQANESYTLFMTAVNISESKVEGKHDPNSLINGTQYHNWIYYNVPGGGKGIMAGGQELLPYYPPGPLQENEYRVYVILIFRQQQKIVVKLRRKKKFLFFEDKAFYDLHRSQFTIRKFAERYKLLECVAGNYFHVENYEYDES